MYPTAAATYESAQNTSTFSHISIHETITAKKKIALTDIWSTGTTHIYKKCNVYKHRMPVRCPSVRLSWKVHVYCGRKKKKREAKQENRLLDFIMIQWKIMQIWI